MSAQNIALLCLTLFVISNCSDFANDKFIANMDKKCMNCICHASTGCNDTLTPCVKGYCGPFSISKVYWVDTGKIVLDEDDPERNNAFEDCAFQYNCAARIVFGYMEKFGRDCNSDGVTDCYDYLMLHFNGGSKCQLPLEREASILKGLQRYNDCYGI